MKNTIDITSLISVLSLIISLGSLFINYLVYKFYTPKLIFKLIPHSYYFYLKDLESKEYDSEKAAVISLKISNSSSFPITIDEVYIKNHTKITVYTDTIAVISRDGKKREFYTVRMGD